MDVLSVFTALHVPFKVVANQIAPSLRSDQIWLTDIFGLKFCLRIELKLGRRLDLSKCVCPISNSSHRPVVFEILKFEWGHSWGSFAFEKSFDQWDWGENFCRRIRMGLLIKLGHSKYLCFVPKFSLYLLPFPRYWVLCEATLGKISKFFYCAGCQVAVNLVIVVWRKP